MSSSDQLGWGDRIQQAMFGTTTPMDDFAQWGANKLAVIGGYVTGYNDASLDQKNSDKRKMPYQYTDPRNTPVYLLGPMMETTATADVRRQQEIDVKLEQINSKLAKINAGGYTDQELSTYKLKQDPGWLKAYISNYKEGADYSMLDVKSGLEESRNRLNTEKLGAKSPGQVLTDAQIRVRKIEAASGFLVAAAGIKPSWAKALMTAHLLTDAALGVFNFRGPNPNQGYSAMQIANPYLTMGALILSNKAATAASKY